MYNGRFKALERRALRRRAAKLKIRGGTAAVAVAAGPVQFAAILFVSVALLWACSIAIFSLVGNDETFVLFSRKRELLPGFPGHDVDLWPDDSKSLLLANQLMSCLPEKEDNVQDQCLQRRQPGSSVQRIGILRPPGLLGTTLEEFVGTLVYKTTVSDESKGSLELIATSHIDRVHSFTKIIRFATLPTLLEALDLALGTVDKTFLREQITLKDVLGVVRLLVRWHCRLTDIADDSALLTLTTKMVMSHPSSVKKNLILYLGLKEGPQLDNIEQVLDGRAGKVLLRIDDCTAFAALLQHRLKKEDLNALVDKTIKEELEMGACDASAMWNTDILTTIPHTRVTEIVGNLLDTHESASSEICRKYPRISLCTGDSALGLKNSLRQAY